MNSVRAEVPLVSGRILDEIHVVNLPGLSRTTELPGRVKLGLLSAALKRFTAALHSSECLATRRPCG